MLPRQYKLKKTTDFKSVFEKGHKVRDRDFLLVYKENGENKTRIGLVISSKVSKKATLRNQLRRKITESLRGRINDIKTGLDIIIVLQEGVVRKKHEDINKNLTEFLKKEGLLIKTEND